MIKKYAIIVLTLTGFLFCSQTSGRQNGVQGNVQLFTDRTLYITGEQMLFSGILRSEGDSVEKVLYVELITPDGRKITGGKYMISKHVAQGCLKIPEEVITGNYYLRAYTRHMRNYGSTVFDYVPLKVVNPEVSNVLTLNNRPEEVQILDSGASGDGNREFVLSSDKTIYKQREKAVVMINGLTSHPSGSNKMCIAVIPENTLTTKRGKISPVEEAPQVGEGIYKMETRGVSISGQLVEKASGTPVYGGIVTLSVIGDKDFSAYRTDRQGRFFFSLPAYFGSRDIFLSASGLDQNSTSLLIDNDFSTIPVKLPNPPFQLSAVEKKAAYNSAVNQMVSADYQQGFQQDTTDSLGGEIRPFYGLPTETLLMDKFVQLPTLEEYFNELPVEVRVRERKNGKYFKFNSKEAAMMANDPLVMVDWVAISDVGKLLQLSPQRIEKIEIVNKPYIKGNLTYGGIISILSGKGDFAGIDLPASGLFLKYELFTPSCGQITAPAGPQNLPDARNTVFWQPIVETASGTQEISMTMPDTPGNYVVVIRGLQADGRYFFQSLNLQVE